MNHPAFLPAPERPDNKSLLLSAAVHLLLLAALFFGVQWKSKAPTAVEVEVWRAAAPSTVAPPPRPEPPPPPKPEPKPEPKIEPTPPAKPDIAIKDEKKKKEEPKKPEKPEPRKEEARKPEPKRDLTDIQKQLEQESKQLQQQKAIEEQRARATAEANAEASRLSQIRNDQAVAARKGAEEKYRYAIGQRIKSNIMLPTNIVGNPEAIIVIVQLPTGDVLPPVRIEKSTGNKLLDEAIERAVLKSSPLPKPENPEDFSRELRLVYRPFESR